MVCIVGLKEINTKECGGWALCMGCAMFYIHISCDYESLRCADCADWASQSMLVEQHIVVNGTLGKESDTACIFMLPPQTSRTRSMLGSGPTTCCTASASAFPKMVWLLLVPCTGVRITNPADFFLFRNFHPVAYVLFSS